MAVQTYWVRRDSLCERVNPKGNYTEVVLHDDVLHVQRDRRELIEALREAVNMIESSEGPRVTVNARALLNRVDPPRTTND